MSCLQTDTTGFLRRLDAAGRGGGGDDCVGGGYDSSLIARVSTWRKASLALHLQQSEDKRREDL
eukprot:scaffold22972_cov43-Tisochrysis_lutea.AAC.2